MATERRPDRGWFPGYDEMMAQPFWRRVPPWWMSIIIVSGAALRLGTGTSRGGWWTVLDLAVILLGAVSIVVDLRRRRSRKTSPISPPL